MLKFSLKKERLDFMKGWSTSEEAAMTVGVSKATGDLGSLFVDDAHTALDVLLENLSNHN